MAGRIPQKDVEAIKTRISIADVVGEYVQLKSAGVGSLKGLCPFHDEKSPSFNVRDDQGFYHCFGCSEGGDVYKFLQKIENITFYEAVEKCASKISYQIQYEAGSRDDGVNRARLLAANEAAAKFFAENLTSTEAQTAREFLTARNFVNTAAEHFGFGYAPNSWTALSENLKAQGFTEEELIKVDLMIAKEGKRYDKFRGRLIWPIRDATNAVVGFGARKIYEDDPLAKYVNTGETPVYHKSQVLYGLDLAKKEIVQNRQVVVVEGYTDVMACHLAGIKTAVATCGTAFGDDHIRKINQLFGSSDQPAEVIFTFDPDAAGQKAAMRAFESSGKFIATTFVAVGPEGLDPCDLRIKQGDLAVEQMILSRRPIYEFAIDQKISGHNLASYPGRLSAATAAVSVLVRVKDLGAREEYVRVLASKVQLGADEINRLLQQELAKQRAQAVQGARRGEVDPVEPSFHEEAPEFPVPNLSDANTRFEQEVLAVLLQIPSAWQESQVRQICAELFATVSYNVIAQAAQQSISSLLERNWLETISANTPEALHSLIRSLAAKPLPIVDSEKAKEYAEGVINRAVKKILERSRAALISSLAQTDQAANPEEHIKLQRELVNLEEKIRALP
ncbi:MAG: DNA primase [Rhodoluna sp.]